MTALRSLGDPANLARTYREENALARAECNSSPLVILSGLRSSARSGPARGPYMSVRRCAALSDGPKSP